MSAFRFFSLLICCTVLVKLPVASGQAPSMQDEASAKVVGFDQIRSVLRRRCTSCHNPDEMRGDLNLMDLTSLKSGGASGEVVQSGNPNQSLLYTTAAHLEDPVMPPNSPKIPARELDLIRRWILGGLAEKTGVASASQVATAVAAPTASKEAEQTSHPSVEPVSLSDASTLAKIRPLVRAAAIQSIATHPTQPLAAVAGRGQAVLVDTQSGQLVGAVDVPEGEVTALCFSPNGELLLIAAGEPGISGSIFGYQLNEERISFRIADETDSILAMDISPDERFVAVGGPKRNVKIYDRRDGRLVHTLRKHTDWILSIQFSPDGVMLASADRFGGLFVWDVEGGELFHNLRGHRSAIYEVCWDVDAETLVTVSEDATIRTWNMHHGEQTSLTEVESNGLLCLERSAGRTVTGSRDGTLTSWGAPGQQIASRSEFPQIESIAAIAGGTSLLLGDATGRLMVIDSETLKTQHEIRLPVDADAYGQLLADIGDLESQYEIQRSERIAAAEREPESIAQPSGLPLASDGRLGAMDQLWQSTGSRIETLQESMKQSQGESAKLAGFIQQQKSLLDQLQAQQQAISSMMDEQQTLLTELQKDRAVLRELVNEALLDRGESDEAKRERLTEQLREQQNFYEKIRALQAECEQLQERQVVPNGADGPKSLFDGLIRNVDSILESTEGELKQLDSRSNSQSRAVSSSR